jgi:hypothetical protein
MTPTTKLYRAADFRFIVFFVLIACLNIAFASAADTKSADSLPTNDYMWREAEELAKASQFEAALDLIGARQLVATDGTQQFVVGNSLFHRYVGASLDALRRTGEPLSTVEIARLAETGSHLRQADTAAAKVMIRVIDVATAESERLVRRKTENEFASQVSEAMNRSASLQSSILEPAITATGDFDKHLTSINQHESRIAAFASTARNLRTNVADNDAQFAALVGDDHAQKKALDAKVEAVEKRLKTPDEIILLRELSGSRLDRLKAARKAASEKLSALTTRPAPNLSSSPLLQTWQKINTESFLRLSELVDGLNKASSTTRPSRSANP